MLFDLYVPSICSQDKDLDTFAYSAAILSPLWKILDLKKNLWIQKVRKKKKKLEKRKAWIISPGGGADEDGIRQGWAGPGLAPHLVKRGTPLPPHPVGSRSFTSFRYEKVADPKNQEKPLNLKEKRQPADASSEMT